MNASPKTYSAFWPLQIFLVSTGLWLIYEVVETNHARAIDAQAVHELLPKGEAAVNARKKLLSLVQDLSETAHRDPSAGQILKDCQISLSAPTGTSPTNEP